MNMEEKNKVVTKYLYNTFSELKQLCAKDKGYFINEEKYKRALDMFLNCDEDIDAIIKMIDFEKKKPSLLHGRAASVLMREKFKIVDPEILEAVANHTSGIIGMCDLTKCLFLADKIEPGRPQSTDEYRENLLAMTLDDMLYSVLEENYEYLTKHCCEIMPGTREMIDYYAEERMPVEGK